MAFKQKGWSAFTQTDDDTKQKEEYSQSKIGGAKHNEYVKDVEKVTGKKFSKSYDSGDYTDNEADRLHDVNVANEYDTKKGNMPK